jgi:oligopeptide/dipeptide ABC transporter ATP-binding protein
MTETTDDPLARESTPASAMPANPMVADPVPADPVPADPAPSEPADEDDEDDVQPTADPFDPQALIRGRRQWPLPKQAVPGAPLLVVEHLTTRFKMAGGSIKAVDDVSFTLNDGEALGIAGESGCGKTTTALSLVRLLPGNGRIGKDSSVKLFGIDLAKKSEDQLRRYRWREISIIFQGAMNALNPVRRINEQIAEPIELRLKVGKDDALKRAGELLELVGIPAKRGQAYPHEMSGGMRQRAMIAMALACDPAVVIGDEPTTALDVMVQAQILELLERLRRELGLSLILITHDLSVIAETCDRVMVMYAGKVAEEGRVDVIFRTPRHPYTQKLIGAFPNIHADRRTLDLIPGSPPDLRQPPAGCRFHPRCPFAMAVCQTEVPPEVTFRDGVRVACHLYPPGSDGVPITKPTRHALGVIEDETGLGAGVFSDRSEVLQELSNEEPGDPFTIGPSHGLTDDSSLDKFE